MGKKGLKKKDWLFVVLGFILFVPTAMVIVTLVHARLNPKVLDTAPDFEDMPVEFATDPEGGLDRVDSTLTLESMDSTSPAFMHWRGSRVIVIYFSARCSHCKKAFPAMQTLADSLGPKGFRSIAVAINANSHDAIEAFARSQNSHLAMFHDEGKRFGQFFGLRTVPSVLLIDTNGAYITIPGFKATSSDRIRKGLGLMARDQLGTEEPGT